MMASSVQFQSLNQADIPLGWVIKTLGDELESLEAGVSVNSTDDQIEDRDFCILKTSAVSNGIFNPKECKKIDPIDITRAKLNPKKDSIIISRMNTPSLVGECGYVEETHHNLFLPDRLWQTKFKMESKVLPKWLNYLLNTSEYKLKIKGAATGTSNSMKNIAKNTFLNLKIPIPPLPEQRAIAEVLSTADAALHNSEKLIAQKEQRKKWLMEQLLTGKKRLRGFEGEWNKYCYADILKVVKRPVSWDDNELYRLISVRRRSGGIFYRDALHGHEIKVKDLREAQTGDFLFSKMQILHGASALVTEEFDGAKISGSYIATIAKDSRFLNMQYFNWYSQLPFFYHQALISSYGVHIEKMTFDFDTFLQLEIELPSVEEQTAIAQVLQVAEKEIKLLKAKAEKLREQKQGLMQVLLTGKVRLKGE
jgi:type I restriction enzyme, S subunit